MKKWIFVLLAVSLLFIIIGSCKRKSADNNELSMQDLTELEVETPVTPESDKALPKELKELPPPGPYQPSIHQIQTALKNAGYYTGNVDGKSGPLTEKAIKDFQKANNLKVDGKVGPNTWQALSKYSSKE